MIYHFLWEITVLIQGDTRVNRLLLLLLFQTAIRDELSKMSFEELQKLKEQLGSKVYNEAIFGTSQMKKTCFKRENKNR
jgi:hypothetical protein